MISATEKKNAKKIGRISYKTLTGVMSGCQDYGYLLFSFLFFSVLQSPKISSYYFYDRVESWGN